MGEGEAMKAQVSALMDGELNERESMETLRVLCGDAELRRRWADYHRIAASLRGEPEFDLVARVMTAIDAESTRSYAASHTILDRLSRLLFLGRRCVDFGHAPAWALAASLAGVAVVIVWAMSSAPAPGERLGVLQARVEMPPALAPSPSSRASLQEYLLAHQAYAPGGALTGGTRNIRSVHRVAASGGGR